MSRWLLVELYPELDKHRTTRTGVWCSITQIPGIKSLTDISAISRRTADELVGDVFLPEDHVLVDTSAQRRPRKRNGAT
jgi:hypothetical protein